jgi:large subunit ribosomal protein L18
MKSSKSVPTKVALRQRRKLRGRKKISGSLERPRLSIFRSSYHVSAQVIDDINGKTIASIHSFAEGSRANKDVCAKLGKELAARCKSQGVSKVVFDKNGYMYHGRIKALADGAREGGLDF